MPGTIPWHGGVHVISRSRHSHQLPSCSSLAAKRVLRCPKPLRSTLLRKWILGNTGRPGIVENLQNLSDGIGDAPLKTNRWKIWWAFMFPYFPGKRLGSQAHALRMEMVVWMTGLNPFFFGMIWLLRLFGSTFRALADADSTWAVFTKCPGSFGSTLCHWYLVIGILVLSIELNQGKRQPTKLCTEWVSASTKYTKTRMSRFKTYLFLLDLFVEHTVAIVLLVYVLCYIYNKHIVSIIGWIDFSIKKKNDMMNLGVLIFVYNFVVCLLNLFWRIILS